MTPSRFALLIAAIPAASAAIPPASSQQRAPRAVAPVATMNAQAMQDIALKIIRQVQPCAEQQVKPSPHAARIRVTLRIQLNRDGSLAGDPQVLAHDGVDDENRRYVDRIDKTAMAIFKNCSPLHGLPPELYDVPRGWNIFTMRYQFPA